MEQTAVPGSTTATQGSSYSLSSKSKSSGTTALATDTTPPTNNQGQKTNTSRDTDVQVAGVYALRLSVCKTKRGQTTTNYWISGVGDRAFAGGRNESRVLREHPTDVS